jgi:hypothetical protein
MGSGGSIIPSSLDWVGSDDPDAAVHILHLGMEIWTQLLSLDLIVTHPITASFSTVMLFIYALRCIQ